MGKGIGAVRAVYKAAYKFKHILHRIFVEPVIKKSFASCGVQVRVPAGCSFSGIENISVGNRVFFGGRTRILTTKAKTILGNQIMFGPGVTIITGDHRMDVLGKYMAELTDADKLPENDADVVIEDDVWIGANVTILKGVTIGRGSVIAAGTVVTKSCPPYSILVGGASARVLRARFTEDQIAEHERLLSMRKSR